MEKYKLFLQQEMTVGPETGMAMDPEQVEIMNQCRLMTS